jgi:hypothetical protein
MILKPAYSGDDFGLARVCQAWRGLLTEDLNPAIPGPILDLLGSR